MERERRITFKSGDLSLEGMLGYGERSDLAAVVLHPHPQYGGDMDNHVVLALCSAISRCGAATLRFNFRGTGRSEGTFDGGRREVDDALAAIGALREAAPDARIAVVGYSFGAMVAAGVAGKAAPSAVVLVSPPSGMMQMPGLTEGVPALLVTGGRDSIAPPASVRAYAGRGVRVVVVPEADHGWWPGVDSIETAVSQFLSALTPDS